LIKRKPVGKFPAGFLFIEHVTIDWTQGIKSDQKSQTSFDKHQICFARKEDRHGNWMEGDIGLLILVFH
jgi:hypothetical protein